MKGEIYGLYDPRTGALRYIGQTMHGARRRSYGHLCDAKRKPHTHVARWLLDLTRAGLRPEVRVLATCEDANGIGALEQQWIAEARAAGENLTNLTDGGDGGTLGFKHTALTIEKMRLRPNVWSGRTHNAESKLRMSETQKRLWASRPDLREAQSKRHAGKCIQQSQRDAVAAASKRSWSDPAFRERIKNSRSKSEAWRAGHAKQADALRGRQRDREAVEVTSAKCRKPVIDQRGIIYGSLDAAARAIGVSASNVSGVVNGHRPHTKGFVFRRYFAPMEKAS